MDDNNKKIRIIQKIEVLEKMIHNLKLDVSQIKDDLLLINNLMRDYLIVAEKINEQNKKKGWFY